MKKNIFITKYPQGFRVKIKYDDDRAIVMQYLKEFTEYDMVWNRSSRRKELTPINCWASADSDRRTFYFLGRSIDRFLQLLKINLKHDDEIDIEEKVLTEGDPIHFELPTFEPREEQVKALSFLEQWDSHVRIITLPTGKGKTVTALASIAAMGVRSIVTCPATNIPDWLKSIKEFTDLKKENIMVISSPNATKKLNDLVMYKRNYPEEFKKVKLILMSITTVGIYLKNGIKENRENPQTYATHPEDFIDELGIGYWVVDEAFRFLKICLRRASIMPTNKNLYLSATLHASREMVRKIYEELYPQADRFKDYTENDHVMVYPTYYAISEMQQDDYMGDRGYSHNKFEASIIKNKWQEGFFEKLYEVLKQDYIDIYRDKLKAIVFFSTVQMCNDFKKYLELQVANNIRVNVVVAGVDKSIIDDTEIIVTTPGSCGTGTDIKNLCLTVLTVAYGSLNAFEQVHGRTRPIKAYDDMTPVFRYMLCSQVHKHTEYFNTTLPRLKKISKDIQICRI